MTTHTRIEQGEVEGLLENNVHKFHGIPYAAPPIGERRWREPAPPEAWASIREAKQFGPACFHTVGATFDMRVQVARNIESFSGASDNVTIFGESAGALLVRTLLSVRRARGLFHRAIIQSAGFEPYAFGAPPSYEQAKEATERLFKRLGTNDPDQLRQISA
ncbi:hypothetical protein BZG36_03010 [Bifiguratus adelaidae]|uniref:Carboxylesterase type B domain-containing protein n=1 Tax=Bifiguratus adelaidae TaxID=1938954 RepID=A0A261XZL1_9FUNG|nr:hypothetical protein BZG36_03010 [Bifiguratus adelaidae]